VCSSDLIESTIIEREVIVSMRDHHMWSRSSRVDDPTKFEIHPLLKTRVGYLTQAENIKIEMHNQRADGIRQDEFRMMMPLTALTKYTVSLNLRSLIKLHGHFRNIASTICDTLYHELYSQSADEIRNVIYCLCDFPMKYNVEEYISSFNRVNVTPHYVSDQSGMAGGFITISVTVPFTLRTHLIRHRMVQINDDLNMLMLHKDFPHFNLNTPTRMNISSSVEFWKKILETRSCWLTHYGIWKPIIQEVSKFIPMEENMLPCAGGEIKCPFATDNEARLKGNDPNPPCPIYIDQNEEILIDRGLTIAMNEQVIRDHRPEFWFNKIDKAGEEQ